MLTKCLDYCIERKNSVILTLLLYVGLCLIAIIISFTQQGEVLSAKGDCDQCAIGADICTDTVNALLSPFRFKVFRENCACGTFQCGWPEINFQFRSAVSFLSFFSGLHGLYWVLRPPSNYRYEHFFILLVCFIFYTGAWWALFSIDADANRTGKTYCETFDGDSDPLLLNPVFNAANAGSGGSLESVVCLHGPFTGTTINDCMLACLSCILGCILYRGSTKPDPGSKNQASSYDLFVNQAQTREGATNHTAYCSEPEGADYIEDIIPDQEIKTQPVFKNNSYTQQSLMSINVPNYPSVLFEQTDSESNLYLGDDEDNSPGDALVKYMPTPNTNVNSLLTDDNDLEVIE